MNNEFNSMMKEMVQTMMMSMMKETMKEMMSEMVGSKPEVANAEVVTTKAPKTLSREEFLALTEESIEEPMLEEIELVVYDNKGLKFNRPVSKDIWTINYLTLKSKYPNVKYDKATRGFRWNKTESNEFRIACRDYQVITVITEEHEKVLHKYYQEKARRKAEWYAGKADAYLDSMNNNI